jgi:hypothetical protein
MLVDLWQVLIGLGAVLITVAGILTAIAKNYLKSVTDQLSGLSRVQSTVEGHAREFLDVGRRLSEINDRLNRNEGSIDSELRRMGDNFILLSNQLAELRGELRILDKVRGIVGNRKEDKS